MRKFYLKQVLAVLLLLCSTVASAHEFEVDGIYYNILSEENKTVEVTFKGSSFSSAIYSGNVVIPESVTHNNIIYSVSAIGDYAFHRCYSLTGVEIPNSITSLGQNAFYYCYKLSTITIPNSIKVVEGAAFDECSGLGSVHIDDLYAWCNIDFWGNFSNPLSYARNLYVKGEKITNLVIPNGVTELKNNVFYCYSSLTSIEIPNSVTSIADYAFYNCYNLTNIKIPVTITSIGRYAFYRCSSLTNIEIPNSVTSIGNCAFEYCNKITSIEIPATITSIGYNAFYECSSLSSITSLIPADKLFAISSVFEEVDKNACTLYVPAGAKETYEASEGWSEFTNIVELPASFDLTISTAEYATLYLDYNAVIPAGVRVYYAEKIEGETLMMERINDVIPASTAIIVTGAAGTYTFEQTFEKIAAIENNLFRGSVEDTYITPEKGTKYYVLSIVDGVVGMYLDELAGGTFKNNAHKAYLPLDGESLGIFDTTVNSPSAQLSNRYTFNFGGTTAVEVVNAEKASEAIYNLNGVREENLTKGIYIVNGKKVVY